MKLKLKCEVKQNYSIENKNFVLCAKFEIPGFSLSGTKIDKAEVKNV